MSAQLLYVLYRHYRECWVRHASLVTCDYSDPLYHCRQSCLHGRFECRRGMMAVWSESVWILVLEWLAPSTAHVAVVRRRQYCYTQSRNNTTRVHSAASPRRARRSRHTHAHTHTHAPQINYNLTPGRPPARPSVPPLRMLSTASGKNPPDTWPHHESLYLSIVRRRPTEFA